MAEIHVCGLDPSIRAFGASVGKETIVVNTEPRDDQTQYQNLQRRCQEIIAKILLLINRHIPSDEQILFVVESPSYGSTGGLVEAGWMLAELFNRLPSMTGRICAVTDVAPSTLKKWVTGNGRADKLQVAQAIKERWGVVFERDKGGNKADAYALYQFGLALLDGEVKHSSPRRGKGGKKNAKRKADSKTASTDKPDKPVRSRSRTRSTA